MSLPDEERRALRSVWEFLLDLSSGAERGVPSATRTRARDVSRHYPIGGDPHALVRAAKAPDAPPGLNDAREPHCDDALVSRARLEWLRERMPDVYQEVLELRNISAMAHNAIASRSETKRFMGKLYALAESVSRRDQRDNGDRTQLTIELERMRRDGWRNCHSW